MNIDPELYDKVMSLAADLTTAVEQDNEDAYMFLYSELEKLCAEPFNSRKPHPFAVETLGDFTLNDENAIDIYEKALDLVEELGLPEHRASIQLSIAERYQELEDLEAARSYAVEAMKSLEDVDDQGLHQELAEFMQGLKPPNHASEWT